MRPNRIGLALCAGLLGVAACAHDSKPRERTSVSAITNEEVADHRAAEGKTRMQYTEVNNDESLGRNNSDVNSTLADERGTSTQGSATAGQAGDAESCELAVYFDTDSARLKEGAAERLDRVADCMKRREIDHAVIVGQTDPSGSEQHNQELGLERARVVAEYLKGRGVPEDQIRVRSKGEVASAESREVWPVERRAGVNVKPR